MVMSGLLRACHDRSRLLEWVQIGAMGGPTIELPSEFLRSASLRTLGTGQGAGPSETYRAELASLVHRSAPGPLPSRSFPSH